MANFQCYVRGHGGEEEQMFPPSEPLPIDLITVGQLGCTMSDQVADELIFKHYSFENIKSAIAADKIIYWTRAQRDNWYNGGGLAYEQPKIDINPYETLNINLALDGDAGIGGDCGLFYWDALNGSLKPIIVLKHKETIRLLDILMTLKAMLKDDDTVQLFWTACMSGDKWPGSGKKVSFNPEIT